MVSQVPAVAQRQRFDTGLGLVLSRLQKDHKAAASGRVMTDLFNFAELSHCNVNQWQ